MLDTGDRIDGGGFNYASSTGYDITNVDFSSDVIALSALGFIGDGVIIIYCNQYLDV